ncbi:hypothetical protein FA15DRAFT_708778 [Coprinopsis marcescibilis]|uniref:Uncharacterized protein n=1 Tax=Coprinopsis marcescibilis TaxID=230819 RepID=A0A5C3KIH4_COPMA|nr:hypothetical protein FA15DRAFT_708778 [Coprinopsis marcescibilis]
MGGSESAWRTLSNPCEKVRNERELVKGGSESALRTLPDAGENVRNEWELVEYSA